MGTQGQRKCCQCGVWFRPHPRNAYHQRFCSDPKCQAASQRASQRKWNRKNPGYFHGEAHVQRVRAWRRKHPGYWKAKGTAEPCGPPDALQEVLTAQGFDLEGVKVFRNSLMEEISRPLQDVMTAQAYALEGLVAMISGEALQEDIAQMMNACYERGQRIGGMAPWMKTPEGKYEKTRADCAATAATGSPPV